MGDTRDSTFASPLRGGTRIRGSANSRVGVCRCNHPHPKTLYVFDLPTRGRWGMCRALVGFASALAALPSAGMAAEQARPFYAGKQITIVVGLPPGGGADAYARLVQHYLARHIDGAPTILVQNMPGAGSLKAVMYLNTTAPADGTVMATFSSALIEEALTAPERVKVDFRSYKW